MLLRRNTFRQFHRRLYAGLLVTVTLLKRGDDQQEGTVKAYVIFQARKSQIVGTGEQIQHDIRVGTRTTWHLPRTELDRVGVAYINTLDRIVDNLNRYWQPEADTEVASKLAEQHLCINCLRVDPPG